MPRMSAEAVHTPWSEPLTHADLQRMPEDGRRYELINGSLLVTPAPNTRHQVAVFRLAKLLDEIPGTMVLPAPLDWIISEHDVPQPDVTLAPTEAYSERGLEGAPLLVAEVLSPSTRTFDLRVKRELYEAAGVPRYWIVDPIVPSVVVLLLTDDGFVEVARLQDDDVYDDVQLGVAVVPSRLVD